MQESTGEYDRTAQVSGLRQEKKVKQDEELLRVQKEQIQGEAEILWEPRKITEELREKKKNLGRRCLDGVRGIHGVMGSGQKEGGHPLPLVLSRMAPLQDLFSHPKQETLCTCSAILLHSLSMVRLCFIDFHISPPGLVRTLHPFLQAVLRSSGLVENVSEDLELFWHDSLCSPVDVLISMSSISLVGKSACPPQTSWFGLQVPPLCLHDQVLHHRLQVRLRVRQNPIIVRPHHAAMLMVSSLTLVNVEPPSFYSVPLWLDILQYLPGHCEPQPWGLNTSLTDASRKR